MCGRFFLQTDEYYQQLIDLVEEVEREQKTKTGEIFPTNTVPVITVGDGGEKQVHLYKWGFPSFKSSNTIINARAETIEEKPMFRKSFHTKRCLIPSHGFFEWSQTGGAKQKYHIVLKDQPIMFMAGIYNTFTDKSGAPYNAFAIITVDANEFMSTIHQRMPVIVRPDAHEAWLTFSPDHMEDVRQLLTPYSSEMALRPVG